MNYVLISCNLWAFYVLPLYRDVWLPSDYLARYYSLCDIGILAPIFVMVIEFCLCDGRLVSSLWWCWISSLWRHCHVTLGWIFWFWNGVLLLLIVYTLYSFMLRYFEKALCYIVSIILVILSMKISFAEIKWKFPKCNMFCVL